jgi:pSer/pThr/pTyr-binding forkhead associated (FHA) protein
MDVRLVVKRGGATKRALQLKSEETIVGRRQDCDLKIRSSEVSRRHCLLSYQDGILFVEDLDSVNGTYLNGRRVAGRKAARPGDELEIGPIRFVVEYQLSRQAAQRLKEQEEEVPEAEEELDELPMAEEEAAPFNFSAEDLEALPLSDADTELAPPASADKEPADALTIDDENDPLPVAEEFIEGKDWHLPQSGELRDILTQMEDPKGKKRPAEEE